jgi:hypothetical protein
VPQQRDLEAVPLGLAARTAGEIDEDPQQVQEHEPRHSPPSRTIVSRPGGADHTEGDGVAKRRNCDHARSTRRCTFRTLRAIFSLFVGAYFVTGHGVALPDLQELLRARLGG